MKYAHLHNKSNQKELALDDNHSQKEASTFENKSDSEIWLEFKNYNESAFIFIYKKYFNFLYQYASQFTSDKGLIKDAIQDLFIELRKSRTKLSPTDSIKRYLFKSIRRKVLYYKSKIKSSPIGSDHQGYDFSYVFSHEHKLIERQLTDEKLSQLNTALTHLTKRQKEATYHFYFQEMSYEDISEVMDLQSVKSARNLVYKAIGELKEILKHDS